MRDALILFLYQTIDLIQCLSTKSVKVERTRTLFIESDIKILPDCDLFVLFEIH